MLVTATTPDTFRPAFLTSWPVEWVGRVERVPHLAAFVIQTERPGPARRHLYPSAPRTLCVVCTSECSSVDTLYYLLGAQSSM